MTRWTSEQHRKFEAARLDKERTAPAKPSKYRNKKTVVDGIEFDSKKEAAHYVALKHLKAAGLVERFEMQVEYDLRTCPYVSRKYRADFVVYFPDGRVEVQDVKGHRTKEYKLKKRLMKTLHKIEIVEK